MRNHQKGSAVILLSIIIILLVVAFGVYIYYQNRPTQTAGNSQPVATSTAVAESGQPNQNAPASNAISVPGMQQYTDSSFGFSFWYPSGWQISPVSVASKFVHVPNADDSAVTAIGLSDPTGEIGMDIIVLNSPPGSLSLPDAGCNATYSFDSASSKWMQTLSGGDGCSGTTPVATNATIDNLPVFLDQEGISSMNYIVPISGTSAVRSVLIEPISGDSVEPLANTVAALDPSIGMSASLSVQEQIIQAEATAYGVQAANTSTANWPTYTNSQYGFSFQYPTAFNSSDSVWLSLYANMPNVMVTPAANAAANYINSAGCYTGIDTARESGPDQSAITLNGMSFCESSGGDPGAGTSHDSDYYTTYHNGNYITIGYEYGDSCGAANPPQQDQCQNAVSTDAPQLFQQSVGTLQFTQ